MTRLSPHAFSLAESWNEEIWKQYILNKLHQYGEQRIATSQLDLTEQDLTIVPDENLVQQYDEKKISEELIEQVRQELPTQPWPKGTHKLVREKFGLSSGQYTRIIDTLIKRRVVKNQINGVLVDDDEELTAAQPEKIVIENQ